VVHPLTGSGIVGAGGVPIKPAEAMAQSQAQSFDDDTRTEVVTVCCSDGSDIIVSIDGDDVASVLWSRMIVGPREGV
jgi:hypothetical protein